jgi:hypothetical protein
MDDLSQSIHFFRDKSRSYQFPRVYEIIKSTVAKSGIKNVIFARKKALLSLLYIDFSIGRHNWIQISEGAKTGQHLEFWGDNLQTLLLV